MSVRPMRPSDREALLEMRLLLDDPGESVLVWEEDGRLGGFVIYALRPFAEGCDSRPVPFIEGWFVREELRRRGVGRALVDAVEDWAREAGFTELGSDTGAGNRASIAAHRRLGFEDAGLLQCFRKALAREEAPAPVVVEMYRGARADLLPLFAAADDSPSEIRTYIDMGEVLVARRVERIVGHAQLIPGAADWEIKSLAVEERMRGQGTGAMLVRAALKRAFSAGASRVLVATAAADVSNLRFYMRLGFRMDGIERDVFTAARGYTSVEVEGIAVRDRLWFSIGADGRDWG